MRVLELCAGYGGLGLGVRIAVPSARVVAVVERQAYCASILMERLEAASMGGPALWPDLESFAAILARRNRRRFGIADPRGAFDMLTAGFPCQPFSVAGQRRGTEDERWLWPTIRRIVGLVRPRLVLVENVPGLLGHTGGFGTILGDLAALGYDAEWDRIPAADVGANHYRFRVWILAYARGESRWPGLCESEQSDQRRGRSCDDGGTRDAQHSMRIGCAGEPERDGFPRRPQEDQGDDGGTADASDSDEPGFREWSNQQVGIIRSGGQTNIGEADEAGTEHSGLQGRNEKRGRTGPTMSSGWRDAEPAPRGMDDGPAAELGEGWYADCPYPPEDWLSRGEPERTEQLHSLGNGCLPLQTALALTLLARRAGVKL